MIWNYFTEHALQELFEAKKHLTTVLKATVDDIQKAEHVLEMAQMERRSGMTYNVLIFFNNDVLSPSLL